jgi:hypothetical protein
MRNTIKSLYCKLSFSSLCLVMWMSSEWLVWQNHCHWVDQGNCPNHASRDQKEDIFSLAIFLLITNTCVTHWENRKHGLQHLSRHSIFVLWSVPNVAKNGWSDQHKTDAYLFFANLKGWWNSLDLPQCMVWSIAYTIVHRPWFCRVGGSAWSNLGGICIIPPRSNQSFPSIKLGLKFGFSINRVHACRTSF